MEIETQNLPARDEFRRITNEQGLKAAIAFRDAKFRDATSPRETRDVPRRRAWDLEPLLAPAVDRDRRCQRVAGLLGPRDRAFAPPPRVRRRT